MTDLTEHRYYINSDYLMFRIRNTAYTDGKLLNETETGETNFYNYYCHTLQHHPEEITYHKDIFPFDLKTEIEADCAAAKKNDPVALQKLDNLNIYCSLPAIRIKEERARQKIRENTEEEIRFQKYIDQHGLEFLQELREENWFRSIVTLMEAAENADVDAVNACDDAIKSFDSWYRGRNQRWN